MKAVINNQEVEVKVVENMGFQNGTYVKAVQYDGEEYIVKKVGKEWVSHTTEERVAPLKEWLLRKKKLLGK